MWKFVASTHLPIAKINPMARSKVSEVGEEYSTHREGMKGEVFQLLLEYKNVL